MCSSQILELEQARTHVLHTHSVFTDVLSRFECPGKAMLVQLLHEYIHTHTHNCYLRASL